MVWHNQIPTWLRDKWEEMTPTDTNESILTREELLEIMDEHITTIASQYKGQVRIWDVVTV